MQGQTARPKHGAAAWDQASSGPRSLAGHAGSALSGLAGVAGRATPNVLLETLGHYAEPGARMQAREADGKADMQYLLDSQRSSMTVESLKAQIGAMSGGLNNALLAGTPEEQQALLMQGLDRASIVRASMAAQAGVNQVNGALHMAGLDGVSDPSNYGEGYPLAMEDVNYGVNRMIDAQVEGFDRTHAAATAATEQANVDHTLTQVKALLAEGKADVAMSLIGAVPEAEQHRVAEELGATDLRQFSDEISPERRMELFRLAGHAQDPDLKLEMFENAQRESNRRNFGHRRSDRGILGGFRSAARVATADARLAGHVGRAREDGEVSMDEVNELWEMYGH